MIRSPAALTFAIDTLHALGIETESEDGRLKASLFASNLQLAVKNDEMKCELERRGLELTT